MVVESRKYGSVVCGINGNVIALHGKVAIGDKVEWLGRKEGSCINDDKFVVGEHYIVAAIYPINFDLELQGSEDECTIRAGKTEYKLVKLD
ncbi:MULTISPECIES: hypothetical protein [Pseudoalteromonas]|jgi:hypothetical protein|uniref:hypothetical protein n=1 Tax=Pseudoalteromonas TaxID=53246 RepID=UPI0004189D77|nr:MULTISPECIES: hypothetical protein [Pseudoalteromonas]PHR99923.1 MAG: hypothetical protein COA80_03115 [Leeuwenhoekiella sp.]MBB1352388.1 hypothetical protein [Pseudoalteromonas sp. SG45-3]MBB1360494.1 hypothetical protein [Pseudoalteromonas sp. SG45-6]MBH0063447.1 hypothetical protein [Pseudoalteromonas sp. NZS71]TVU68278.1 hypothetical protein FQP81_20315 [Pseudoalteromonas elyakovii]|tara:strand:+ start:393 stop:665 length:273 start_codon:yes stop_codon:yes gene_type:complete